MKPAWRNALFSFQLTAAVAFATACDRIVDPALPSTADSFSPPPVYDKWWAMVESCSGTANIGYPGVPPDSLEVSISIFPNPPTRSVDEGVFSFVVSARNPASHPVNVSLPLIDGVPVAPFSYEIHTLGIPGPRAIGTLDLRDPSATTFAAGETKRQYFDFKIGPVIKNQTLAPGSYRFTGSYATRSATLSPVTVAVP